MPPHVPGLMVTNINVRVPFNPNPQHKTNTTLNPEFCIPNSSRRALNPES